MSKYHNLIDKPTKVAVPYWEYARLVAANTKLALVEKIVHALDSYDCKKVLDVLFAEEQEE